jgi:hypothetical protein
MEDRTREALHRVADGLVVSEHDLDRMERSLMTLIDTRPTEGPVSPRPRRDWVVAAVAAAALVVAGVALWRANTDPPSQPADRPAPPSSRSLIRPELVGLWRAQDSPWLWEITSEGRILNTDTAAGYLRAPSDARGGDGALTVTKREGDLYTLAETNPPRTPGDCDTLRIGVVAADEATLADGCPTTGEQMVLHLERVSPRDAAAPALTPRFPAAAEQQVTRADQLEGTWAHQGTGRVLVMGRLSAAAPLSYVLDDDGDGTVRPDRQGVLTVGADGSVRPQPGTSTGQGCAPVFTKVVSNAATLVTTSGEGDCFRAGSTQTWLRLN